MKTQNLLLAVLAAFLVPSLASAKPNSGKGKPDADAIVQRLDQDGDSAISKAEAEAAPRGRLAKAFDRIDTNADGYIVANELRAVGKKAKDKASKLRDADTDGSGGLSFDEAEAAGMQRLLDHFDQVDADGDGEVTPKELRAAMPKGRKGPQASE